MNEQAHFDHFQACGAQPLITDTKFCTSSFTHSLQPFEHVCMAPVVQIHCGWRMEVG